jgi:prepilin-type N-terminal cleavage/methylation domain-containing protein
LKRKSQRGVTLMELMIAITLVAALSTGMLFAMRTSLLTQEKTAKRLDANRRMMNLQQVVNAQLSGAMPITGFCPNSGGGGVPNTFFHGSAGLMRMVSNYSIAQGARGYPQILEYIVAPSKAGTVRLVLNEYPYDGPQSTAPFCTDGTFLPASVRPTSFVIADDLAACGFSFHEQYHTLEFAEKPWLADWNKLTLPGGIRIQLTPAHPDVASLPFLSVTVPIRTTRLVMGRYEDKER